MQRARRFPMLRIVVLLLALLNAVYFAWSQGALQGLGLVPDMQTEPERLGLQIKADALHLLIEAELNQLQTPPVLGLWAPTCLQAGLFNQAQGALVLSALDAHPALGVAKLEATVVPARWIVYMGKYATPDELAKKKVQLAAMNLVFEALVSPELGPGLSLGSYASQAAANKALEGFSTRGVRTARVLLERAELNGMTLHLQTAQNTTLPQLEVLKPALAGKTLTHCP